MARSFYAADLAYIHHVGFGHFATKAAPWLLSELHRAGLRSGLVVDLGCGSGIWLNRAAQAGFQTIGVDISPAMIRLAKMNSPSSKLLCRSLWTFPLPPCSAVTAIGEALCYCPPDLPRPYRLLPLFRRVANALQPGGLFVFDLLTKDRYRSMNARIWSAGDDWAVLTERIERRDFITRNIIAFRKVGRLYRRSFESHRAAIYSVQNVKDQLRRAGFLAVAKPTYGRFRLPPRRTAFFAVKTSCDKR